MLHGFKDKTAAALTAAGVTLAQDAFVFSNDGGTTPWNPDWVTHQVARAAETAGVAVNIKSLRHYTATHLLAAGLDVTNTAARLGHGSGGATTLKIYAHPVSEIDRRAAALLAGTLTPRRPGHGAKASGHRAPDTAETLTVANEMPSIPGTGRGSDGRRSPGGSGSS
jgi:Phage integrase family